MSDALTEKLAKAPAAAPADAPTRWVAAFEHAEEHWINLDMQATDVAERAAQAIADRGGELDQEFAEAAFPELQAIRDGALAREAAPVAVFVPPEPPETRPAVQVTAYVAPIPATPEQATVEFMAAQARKPQAYRFREPEVSVVELPAGPAVRVHEVVRDEKGGDERQVLTEYVSHYVLPPGYGKGFVELTVTWFTPTISEAMVETADEMASTLTVTPYEASGDAT